MNGHYDEVISFSRTEGFVFCPLKQQKQSALEEKNSKFTCNQSECNLNEKCQNDVKSKRRDIWTVCVCVCANAIFWIQFRNRTKNKCEWQIQTKWMKLDLRHDLVVKYVKIFVCFQFVIGMWKCFCFWAESSVRFVCNFMCFDEFVPVEQLLLHHRLLLFLIYESKSEHVDFNWAMLWQLKDCTLIVIVIVVFSLDDS